MWTKVHTTGVDEGNSLYLFAYALIFTSVSDI